MTKNEYLHLLWQALEPLPPAERDELMRDYDMHFVYGAEHGRSEDEIIAQLGNPAVIAAEVLGTRYNAAHATHARPSYRPNSMWKTGMAALLFFVNLILIPLLIAMWAVFISLGVIPLALLLSPLLVLVDKLINGVYYPASLFLSFAQVGVGILLVHAVKPLLRLGIAVTEGYVKWNSNSWKGRA